MSTQEMVTLQQLAHSVLEETEDRERAKELLTVLLKENLDLLLEWGAAQLIEQAYRGRRLRAFGAATAHHGQITAEEADNAFAGLLLMEQFVRPGLKMRHATIADLNAKADELELQARGTMKHAYYCRTIAKRLRDRETPGDAMTEMDLKQIMQLAEKKAGAK